MSFYYHEVNDVFLLKLVVGKDEPTTNVIGHYGVWKCPKDEWLMTSVVKDFSEFGRRDIMRNTDGELAVVSVQEEI